MKSVLLCLVLLLSGLAQPVSAQVVTTGPITTNHKAVWEQSNEASSAAAATLTYRLRIDGATTPVVFVGVVCAVPSPPVALGVFTCTANMPQAAVDKVNVRGTHSLVLRAFDGTTESGDSIPFVLTVPPATATGLRVTQ